MHMFSAIGNRILEVSLPILVPVIGSLLAAVLARQLERLGVQLSIEQGAQLKQGVTKAIQAVEEQARRGRMTSDDKHQNAVEILKTLYPEKSSVELSHEVDAILPEVRAKLAPISSTP